MKTTNNKINIFSLIFTTREEARNGTKYDEVTKKVILFAYMIIRNRKIYQ